MSPLIEFQKLSKIYHVGDSIIRAADNISFKINRGEFVAIVGQSGSGKTTCMNIIGCLDTPTHGSYILGGKNVGKMKDNQLAVIRNEMVGFIFQQYNLLPKLNVVENVELSMYYAGVPGGEMRKRALESIDRVGLSDKLKSRPNQLSGGQQQRVSIARALAGNPSVILADEPTGALDSKTGSEVISLLKDLNREGNTIVLITHDNSIAMEARRMIRLSDGRIIYDGPVVKQDQAQDQTQIQPPGQVRAQIQSQVLTQSRVQTQAQIYTQPQAQAPYTEVPPS